MQLPSLSCIRKLTVNENKRKNVGGGERKARGGVGNKDETARAEDNVHVMTKEPMQQKKAAKKALNGKVPTKKA